MSKANVVLVKLWGKLVGVVSESRNRPGVYSFQYDKKFLSSSPELNLSPGLGSAFPFNPAPKSFPSLNPETFHGLPGLIADALPDKFGNALIDAYMVNLGIAPSDISTMQRLLYMGHRGMGALEFEPAMTSKEDKAAVPLAMSELVENARRALCGKIQDVGPDIIRIGSSAGGARAKAVVGFNPEGNDLVSGQFDLPAGYEHWLLKFDGVGEAGNFGSTNGFGRIEYAYHLMARAAGIDMMECRLLEEGGRAHFMTKRFDRVGNEKLHAQSLCALLHADFNVPYVHDYGLYFRTVQILRLGKLALGQSYRRMVFNVMSKNCDDHTKNLSFLMDKNGSWSLAPAYDLSYAHNPAEGKWTRQHQMLINGKARDITERDLLDVAHQFNINHANEIIDEVKEAVSQWGYFANQAGVEPETIDFIERHHELVRSRPFFTGPPKIEGETDDEDGSPKL